MTDKVNGPHRIKHEKQLDWYWTALLGTYLIILVILLSYMIYNLWPPQPRKDNRGQVVEKPATTIVTPTPVSTPAPAQTPGTAQSAPAPPQTETSSPTPAPPSTPTPSAAEEMLPKVCLFGKWAPVTDASGRIVKDSSGQDLRACQGLITQYGIVLEHSFEVRLLLLVLLAGALGSYIHAATSFVDYVGNRKLSGNWMWWYLLRPFVGMTLALLFYFVVRGGFISVTAGGEDINPFGIAALAGLVGMFSKQATDKLNEVFKTLFRAAEGEGDDKRKDSLVDMPPPGIVGITPNEGPASGGTAVTITGAGFVNETVVAFGDLPATSIVVAGATSLTAITPPNDAGVVDVEVTNPDGQKGALPGGYTYLEDTVEGTNAGGDDSDAAARSGGQ
ncbi:MAG TPA: IPT/TIG domain-containing protein [Pyrinomonadaceae bacterium]